MLANLLSVLSLLSLASAHGIVTSVTVGGTRYAGPPTGSNTNMNSPIRQVAHMNPNLGATSAAITCGPNAKPARAVANVAPGARIRYDWRMGGQAVSSSLPLATSGLTLLLSGPTTLAP